MKTIEIVKEKKAPRPYFTMDGFYGDDDSYRETEKKFYSLKQFIEETELFSDVENTYEFNYIDSDRKTHYLSMEVAQLPHCCGVLEIGELGNLLPDKAMNNFFNHLFKLEYGFIINTTEHHRTWETYLKNSNKFKKLKSFKNANSGNMVTMWIGNN